MQLGSFTIPPLALAAVAGAGVLVVLVLWGVWRARRTPAPAPLPVAPPEVPVGPEPCAEDWTGESAGGPADPPVPLRRRTVADAVAERGADTGPIPGLPVDDPTPRSSSASASSAPIRSADGELLPGSAEPPADPVPEPVPESVPGSAPEAPGPVGRHAAPETGRVEAGGVETDRVETDRVETDRVETDRVETDRVETDRVETGRVETGRVGDDALSAPVDECPDESTFARIRPRPRPAPVARPAARLRIVDDTGPRNDDPEARHDDAEARHTAHDTAHDTAPNTDPDRPADDESASRAAAGDLPAPDRAATPLPPWSAERTVPAVEDLPTGAEPPPPEVPDTDDVPPTGTDDVAVAVAGSPEPVSHAVQQALAARAVHSARMRRAEIVDEPTGEQQELPLSVVPSPPPPPAAGSDVRDRLLGVLLADPVRAVDATQALDESRDRIEQLGDALRRRRDELAGAVRHLHECGLDPAQIGLLSGMATADVRAVLDGEGIDPE